MRGRGEDMQQGSDAASEDRRAQADLHLSEQALQLAGFARMYAAQYSVGKATRQRAENLRSLAHEADRMACLKPSENIAQAERRETALHDLRAQVHAAIEGR